MELSYGTTHFQSKYIGWDLMLLHTVHYVSFSISALYMCSICRPLTVDIDYLMSQMWNPDLDYIYSG